MKIAEHISGLIAVALYLLCFQLKKGKSIVACRFMSSVFYVLQYFLLGAFVGAAMDASAALTAAISYKKDTPFVAKYKIPIIIVTNVVILTVGLLLYDSPFSLLAIAGVLLESASNWMKNEKMLRIVSLFAVPCWLVYNFVYEAYGSAIGSILALISVITALVRYSRNGRDACRGDCKSA